MPVIDIRKTALLARLELSEAEIAQFTPQLEKILATMAALNELDLTGVEPFRPGAQALALREDEINPSFPPAGALRNAPGMSGGFFTVPRVVSKKTSSGKQAAEPDAPETADRE
jgi:aspartyl-tRNA(Asn)/glutamyl-tRNA(Gln) amidotransferase subunit C